MNRFNKLLLMPLLLIAVLLILITQSVRSKAAEDGYSEEKLPYSIFLPMMQSISSQVPGSIYESIRQEALAPNNDANHALPLIGAWNAGTFWNFDDVNTGYTPQWQMEMIQQGHHFYPWAPVPAPYMRCQTGQTCAYMDYYKDAIPQVARLNLPVSFYGEQYEAYLYDAPAYFNLPPDQNPNVVSPDGKTIQKIISPFGPVQFWHDIGVRWGGSPMMQYVVSLYPNPPQVLFIANNEANALRWFDAEKDKHYLDLYGYNRDDNFKRQVFANAWQVRYKALIEGFREGLKNPNWQSRSVFAAYQAFGPSSMGRWSGWKDWSLYVPGRIDPNPLIWEGGSAELYLWPTKDNLDNNGQSPLFGAMNWVFMQNEAYQLNPSFFFELITWDENYYKDPDVQAVYNQLGETFTPDRYGGFVQYAMWLVRPRIVRLFRDTDQNRAEILPWDKPLINAVDGVYSDPILQSFWRTSSLVPNPARPHPYQTDVPPEYANTNRMYLLNTNLDPAQPWTTSTSFPVMSLARVQGASPNRLWLLYAYAPLGNKSGVNVAIPGYRTISIDVDTEGSFYLINESTGSVKKIL